MENGREHVPMLVAWEITMKCHPACRHCRGETEDIGYTINAVAESLAEATS